MLLADSGGEPMTTSTVIVATHSRSGSIGELAQLVREVAPDAAIVLVGESRDVDTARDTAKAGYRLIQRSDYESPSRAIVEGIRSSQDSDTIVVVGGNFSYSAQHLSDMFAALERSDMVVGSRWARDDRGLPPEHRTSVFSRIASLLAWPLAPRFKDRTSAFFGFRTSVVKSANLNPKSWSVGLEVMAQGRYATTAEIPYWPSRPDAGKSAAPGGQLAAYLWQLVLLYMSRFTVLNFMVVGGIGYGINMGAYWLLLKVAKGTETTFLGQHFYLPPFVISSLLAIISNYELNRLWTFRGWSERSVGFLRYLSMALVTLVFDMAVLWGLVDFTKMTPLLAAALAIAIVFVIRYTIAKRWIWSKRSLSL